MGTPDNSVGSSAARRASVSTSLPSTSTTTAPASTNAGKAGAKAGDLPYSQAGGKVSKPGGVVAAQDPYSQQNFKQYGAAPSQAHISPRHARSPGQPSLSPHSPLTSSSAHRSPHSSSTLQVPPGTRPLATASAQRGTNVAVSKRTRFALQVQKPTGEEGTEGGSKESTVSGMDLGVLPSSTAGPGGGLRSPRGGGRGARRSRSPTARGGRGAGREGGMDGAQSQALDGMGRAGRGGGKGRGQAVKGAQPSLSTDDDTLVNTLQRDYIQRGKSRWVASCNICLHSQDELLRFAWVSIHLKITKSLLFSL